MAQWYHNFFVMTPQVVNFNQTEHGPVDKQFDSCIYLFIYWKANGSFMDL